MEVSTTVNCNFLLSLPLSLLILFFYILRCTSTVILFSLNHLIMPFSIFQVDNVPLYPTFLSVQRVIIIACTSSACIQRLLISEYRNSRLYKWTYLHTIYVLLYDRDRSFQIYSQPLSVGSDDHSPTSK